MNRQYLGDALDHWKGSMLHILYSSGRLNALKVDPMITSPEWSSADTDFYVRLLGVSANSLVRHDSSLITDRSAYFKEIDEEVDLFLDPDTGIATSSGSPICKYLKPKEVHLLLEGRSSQRVLCVYQHIGRNKSTRHRLSDIVGCLRSTSYLSACSYESPTVAMLIISKDNQRIERIADILDSYCGLLGDRRVGKW